MQSGYFKRTSLKTRMSLAVTALFVLFVIAASYFTLSYFERSFKETISAQQFSLVSSLADSIDAKLKIAHNSLIVVAPQAPRSVWTSADAAQRFLDSRIGLHSIFDNGIFFISSEGTLIAESPYRPGRRGKDLWFRDWVQKTVTSRTPCISDPYISTHTPGQPAIVMTVPVFDDQGNIKGMMTGSLSLMGKNLLSDLSKVRIGTSGYVFVADMNRTLVVHPDKNRVMKPAAAPGINKMVDQAFKGFEGSGETVTSYGVPMLISIKHLRSASWFLGANYPISEAYAPLEKAKRYFAVTAATATALLLLITWCIMRRLMSPLAAMTRHVEQISHKSGAGRLIEIDAMDEIGILATEFNSMIRTMDRDRDSLEERISTAVQELRQKDQLLIQQSRQAAMGEMIGNIAHQWRQPLNVLGLTIQELSQVNHLGEIDRELLDQNVSSSMVLIQHMSRTIDDFRNYFRPDKDKSAFNVHETIATTLSLLEGSLQNPHISIELIQNDTPVIVGYQNEFAQALLNILLNAREACMERGVDAPRVTISAYSESDRAVVTIGDNAGGIPEEIIGKVFDPYFSTKGPQQGTGVGLFMSKSIIEKNMGGTLTVRNTASGAEFRIEVASESLSVPSPDGPFLLADSEKGIPSTSQTELI